jgi:hypothetical protein
VRFDGVDDFMILPAVPNVASLSMWMYRSSAQPSSDKVLFFLDARPGVADGAFSSLCVPPVCIFDV